MTIDNHYTGDRKLHFKDIKQEIGCEKVLIVDIKRGDSWVDKREREMSDNWQSVWQLTRVTIEKRGDSLEERSDIWEERSDSW